MKIVKYTFPLILLIGLLSCASTQQITKEESPVKEDSKLLFLNYEIEKLNDKKTIRLINQITADGRLKRKIKHEPELNIEDLECLVLDKDSNLLETYHIKNPLRKIVEYINDSGSLEKTILDLDHSEFSLKLQLHSQAKYIQINEKTSTGIIKHITTKID